MQPTDTFSTWFEVYYRHPQPDQVHAQVIKLSEDKLLGKFNIIDLGKKSSFHPDLKCKHFACTSSVAEIFRRHPDRVWEWMKSFKSLPEQSFYGLIDAVWMSNTPKGREALEKISNSTFKASDYAKEVLSRPVFDVDKFTAITPIHFDHLWSAFAVTGDNKYVGKILEAIEVVAGRTDISPLEIQVSLMSIRWSTNAQMNIHPEIIMYIIQYCSSPARKHPLYLKILDEASNLLLKNYPKP